MKWKFSKTLLHMRMDIKIFIAGKTYQVVKEYPVTAKGYEGRSSLYLKPVNGTTLRVATKYKNGLISTPTALWGWKV
jgi:hypothetical protein